MAEHIYLKPGEYYVSNSQTMISTVLGSCVAACLFDPINKVMGMNHFLLSGEKIPPTGEPYIYTKMGRYGVHAMELLINELLKLGAKKKNIQAKVFGGARLLMTSTPANSILNVGLINCQFVKNFLNREKIPILSSDLEGHQGRVIRFYSDEFAVYVKKIKPIENEKLIKEEKAYLKKSLEKKKRPSPKVELWD